jgi:hypothetical protein
MSYKLELNHLLMTGVARHCCFEAQHCCMALLQQGSAEINWKQLQPTETN